MCSNPTSFLISLSIARFQSCWECRLSPLSQFRKNDSSISLSDFFSQRQYCLIAEVSVRIEISVVTLARTVLIDMTAISQTIYWVIGNLLRFFPAYSLILLQYYSKLFQEADQDQQTRADFDLCSAIIIMIGEIIKEVYRDDDGMIRNLIEIPIVAGCLFRSFDELTQNLILRMVTNGGTIEKKEILGMMDKTKAKKEGNERFDRSMANLEKLRIVTRSGFENPLYTLDHNFETKLNDYIESPFKINGEELKQEDDSKEFFNLLGLLRENNEILRECRIGNIRQGRLSKENFDFIRLPLGYKISILIKGYLLYKRRTRNYKVLRDVLCLSLAEPGKKYKLLEEKQEEIIKELERIRLVRRVEGHYFTVSEFLCNFAFEERSRESRLLDCSMIVETNFKVYVQVPRGVSGDQNYELIHSIMKMLVELEHEQHKFRELIVGSITRNRMNEVFQCRISVSDYLSFFRAYMFGDLSIEKDLGKWNKIHFLGLQGPAEELMIPNNVKQELKLWQSEFNRQRQGEYREEIQDHDDR